MTRGQTYYELLGLTQDATAPQIRGAYLRLIKQHHPDGAGNDRTDARPELVPIINRCYATLKDPQKRAAYDAELALRSPPARKLASPQAASTARRHRRWLLYAIVALGSVTSIAAVAQFASPGSPRLSDPFSWIWLGHQPLETSHAGIALPNSKVRRAVQLAMSLPDDQAVSLSERCFASADRTKSIGSAELCIVFDEAFRYWNTPDADADFPIYFNEQVAQIRHREALAMLGSRCDSELQELQEKAFRGLFQQVRASAPPETNDTGTGNSGGSATH